MLKLLVSMGADVKMPMKNGDSLITIAISGGGEFTKGTKKTVLYLLDQGCNIKGNDGRMALLAALHRKESYPLVQILVDRGVDIRAGQQQNKDMLMELAMNPFYPKGIEFLLQHGADPNISGNIGRPLDVAENPEIIHSLLQHGAIESPKQPSRPSFLQTLRDTIHGFLQSIIHSMP